MTATMPTDLRSDAEILADAIRAGDRLEVTLAAGDLKRGLALAKPAIANRTYMSPALRSVKLEARGGAGGTLRITATDLDLTAHAEVEANHVTGRGTVLIDPKALSDALKGVKPRDMVRLAETADGTLDVIRPDGRRTIRCGQLDEYPRLPALEPLDDPLQLDSATWARLAQAASTDEQRPPLTGVMVDGVDLVSTDSYRLHHHGLDQAAPFTALVSGRAIRAAVKTKTSFDVFVTREQSGGARQVAVFACAEVTYIGRVIEANFPNWRQLVPSSTAHELEVDGRELARVLRTFPDDGTTAAAVRVRCEGKRIVLSQRAPAEASATIDVDGCRYWPEGVEIAFNRSYLADLVDVDGTVRIECADHLKPIMVRDANLAMIGLLMPVRVA